MTLGPRSSWRASRHGAPGTSRLVVETEPSAAATFEPTLDAPGRARAFVRDSLASWGLDANLEATQLVVSELVANAVVHAGYEPVILRMRVEGPRLRIEVSDGDARGVPQLELPHDFGARGLHLVDAYAVAWGFAPSGTRKTVWCELALVTTPTPRNP